MRVILVRGAATSRSNTWLTPAMKELCSSEFVNAVLYSKDSQSIPMIRQGATARVGSLGISQKRFTDRPNEDVLIFDLMTLHVSAYSLRELEANNPKLAYEPMLRLESVVQLDERFYYRAATGTGTGCQFFEIDALFQVKYKGLSDALRWGHFRGR
jgi:hypothetical protein